MIKLIFSVLVFQQIHGLEVKFSAFSGPVGTVSMGTPPQPVQMAFDFEETPNFVYDMSICPLFVGDCFNVQQSSSGVIAVGEHSLAMPLYGLRSHASVTDLVSIAGAPTRGSVRFALMDTLSPCSTQFKEVAGVLNLNKRSWFMANRAIILFPVSGGFSLFPVIELALRVDFWAPQTRQSAPRWNFDLTSVSIGDYIIPITEISFDPSVRVMRLPALIVDAIRELTIGPSPDYEAPFVCDLVLPISFHLNLSPEFSIEIPWDQLLERSPDGRCRFSFVLSNRFVIGTQLSHSVDSIVLDQILHRIGFTLSSRLLPFGFQTRRPMAPVYRSWTAHVAPDSSSVVIRFSRSGSGRDAMIMANRLAVVSPSPDQMPGLNTVTWWMVYNEPRSGSDITLNRLGGQNVGYTWEGGPRIEHNDGSLVFEFTQAPHSATNKVKVFLERGPRSIGIHIATRMDEDALVPIEELDLPEPEKREAGSEEVCAICLGDFDAEHGEMSQTLRCGHIFHYDCVRQWLEARARNCPVCRTAVGTNH